MTTSWYMKHDPARRLVAYMWDGRTPNALGELTFAYRDDPGDMWSPPITIDAAVTLAVARVTAMLQGFTVEEA